MGHRGSSSYIDCPMVTHRGVIIDKTGHGHGSYSANLAVHVGVDCEWQLYKKSLNPSSPLLFLHNLHEQF